MRDNATIVRQLPTPDPYKLMLQPEYFSVNCREPTAMLIGGPQPAFRILDSVIENSVSSHEKALGGGLFSHGGDHRRHTVRVVEAIAVRDQRGVPALPLGAPGGWIARLISSGHGAARGSDGEAMGPMEKA